jgi:CelD/BcsL family acetyltransferase involved in cellulose biosynthesis
MKIELCSAGDLSPSHLARWDELQRASPELESPYFRPEFTQVVAALRPSVEVALLTDGGQTLGFFPFERSGQVARPVAARLSDYHGLIAASDTPWCMPDILRACRLRAWQFDHQLASQSQLAPYFAKTANSWRIDVSTGYDEYLAGRKAAGAVGLSELLRKFRKLQREHQVRFEWHTADEAVFQQLLAWKSEQYRRSALTDLFTNDWIVSLLKNIWQTQTPNFSGVLSVMYVNESVAAIHFGMQSRALLHSWFPAYDVSLGKFSPGSALLLYLFQHAAEHGVTCVDLGKGEESYKQMFATGGVLLAEGAVDTRLVSAAVNRGWRTVRDWARNSPLRDHARLPIRLLRRLTDWSTLR